MIEKTVTLSIGSVERPERIPVSQFDTMWQFVFSLTYAGDAWSIPAGAEAMMLGRKQDGNVFAFAGTVADGKITVPCDVQMTAVAGPVVCELSIISDHRTIGTSNFILDVEPAPKSPEDVSSETTLPAYGEILDRLAGLGPGGSGGTSVFFATYGTTTSADIEAAYQAGYAVFCHIDTNVDLYLPLVRRDSSTTHVFGMVYKGTSATDEYVMTAQCVSNTWGYAQRLIPAMSDSTPSAPGTASAGTGTTAARYDHVHPLPSAADVGAIVVVDYGTATSAQIEAAYQTGATVLCKYDAHGAGTAGSYVYAPLYRRADTTTHYFSVADGSTILTLLCDNDTWSADTVVVPPGALAVASADQPKPLGTTAVGSSGSFARADHVHALPSASEYIALVTVGTATSAQIEAAYQAGKAVFCVYTGTNYTLLFPLTLRHSATSHVFSGAYKIVGGTNHYSATLQCVNDVWSSDQIAIYTKPSGGIPASDLATAVQTSLGKADTALQSFTETDPTVPSWAKASSKPSYTASEVGAEPAVTEVTVSTAGSVSQALDAGKIYHFTGALTALTVTLTATSGLAHYHFDFDSGSTAPTLSVPNTVHPSSVTIEDGKHYEVDILNNYMVVMSW